MPFAIELHFDERTNNELLRVWSALQQITGVPPEMGLGIAPHVSLAVLPEFSTGLERETQSLAGSMAEFDLPLDGVECFPGGRGVVFINALFCSSLSAAHTSVSKMLSDFDVDNSPLYEPERWRPHCTVATDVPHHLLQKVIATATSMPRPTTARVVALCGVSYRPPALAFRAPFGFINGPAAT